MNKLALNNLDVTELTNDELEDIDGGFAITILAIAIGAGVAVGMYIYNTYCN